MFNFERFCIIFGKLTHHGLELKELSMRVKNAGPRDEDLIFFNQKISFLHSFEIDYISTENFDA